jgi:hypothetical protein
MKQLALVGGIVVVIIVAALYVPTLLGNTDTSLELNVAGGVCTIVTSATSKDVSVKKNKKITWAVSNACPSAQTVMLGNFRTVQGSTRTTCTDATEGAAWPFKDQDQDKRSATISPGQSNGIVLKEARNTSGQQLTYYFDVCLGGVKKDPRLVIEP